MQQKCTHQLRNHHSWMIARASKTALTLLDRDLVIGHTLFRGSRPCLLSHLPQKQSLVMILVQKVRQARIQRLLPQTHIHKDILSLSSCTLLHTHHGG